MVQRENKPVGPTEFQGCPIKTLASHWLWLSGGIVESFGQRVRVEKQATRRAGEMEFFSKNICLRRECHADGSDAKQ